MAPLGLKGLKVTSHNRPLQTTSVVALPANCGCPRLGSGTTDRVSIGDHCPSPPTPHSAPRCNPMITQTYELSNTVWMYTGADTYVGTCVLVQNKKYFLQVFSKIYENENETCIVYLPSISNGRSTYSCTINSFDERVISFVRST